MAQGLKLSGHSLALVRRKPSRWAFIPLTVVRMKRRHGNGLPGSVRANSITWQRQPFRPATFSPSFFPPMKPNNKTETPAVLAAAALVNAAHSLQIEPHDGCAVADLRIEGNPETLATLPAGCLYVLTFDAFKFAAAVVNAAMRHDSAKGFLPFVASGSGRFRRQWIAGLIDLEGGCK